MLALFFLIFKAFVHADNATDTLATTTTTTGTTGAPCGTNPDNGSPTYIDVCGVCGGTGNCSICEYGPGQSFTSCATPDSNDMNAVHLAAALGTPSSSVTAACNRLATYERCVASKYGNKCLDRAIKLATNNDCIDPKFSSKYASIGCAFVCDASALAAPGAGGGINAGSSMRAGGASLLLLMIAALFFAQ